MKNAHDLVELDPDTTHHARERQRECFGNIKENAG